MLFVIKVLMNSSAFSESNMVGLRRQSQGLANDERITKLAILRNIFSAVMFSIAVSGLVGIMIFSCVHWTSFS